MMDRHDARIAGSLPSTESFHLIPYPVYSKPRCVGASSLCRSAFGSYAVRTQRTGVAIGDVNGTTDSVRANVELGSLVSPMMDRYAIMSRYVTGCCAWRASCSLLDIAPTAANIEEYRRKPPRKNAMNTARVANGMCGRVMVCAEAVSAPSARAMGTRRLISSLAETPQMTNWKNDTAPAPITLPSMSWNGRSDETRTSMIRVVFSSSTELMTFTPYSRIAMNRRIAIT